MDIPMTPQADVVSLKIVDGQLMFERWDVARGAVPWMFMSPDERAAVHKLANEQWERERTRSGDPPYSIGNDWLQDLDKALEPVDKMKWTDLPDALARVGKNHPIEEDFER